jgi:predicted nucleic acid-binding protein
VTVILDTNALSAFADGDKKLLPVIESEVSLALPVIALGEFLYGIHQSRLRERYEQWLRANLPLFDLLLIGAETARRYAGICGELKAAGLPIPSNDVWIAALAREHGSPLVSRDQHFRAVNGLRLLTW